jgi:hypothetical protein
LSALVPDAESLRYGKSGCKDVEEPLCDLAGPCANPVEASAAMTTEMIRNVPAHQGVAGVPCGLC